MYKVKIMKVDDCDFAIILSPEKDSDNKWNGAINVKSMFNTDAWKEDEIRTVLEMVTLLTSCIPLLERDDPFLHKVQVEREELIKSNKLHPIYEKIGNKEQQYLFTPIIKVEDNVIHVDMRRDK